MISMRFLACLVAFCCLLAVIVERSGEVFS